MGRQEHNDSERGWSETRLSSVPDKGRENPLERVGGEKTHSCIFFLAVLLHLCVGKSDATVSLSLQYVPTYVHIIVSVSGLCVLLPCLEAPLRWYCNPAV